MWTGSTPQPYRFVKCGEVPRASSKGPFSPSSTPLSYSGSATSRLSRLSAGAAEHLPQDFTTIPRAGLQEDGSSGKQKLPQTTYYLLLTTYYLLRTTYYLLLTTHYLLLTTYYLLLTTYYLQLTTYNLLLTTYYLLLTTYYLLLST